MPDYEIWCKWLRSEGNTMIGRLPEEALVREIREELDGVIKIAVEM